MSYSFERPCHSCRKKDDCTDHEHIQRAVDAIHETPIGAGHQGAGSVVLMCFKQDSIDR